MAISQSLNNALTGLNAASRAAEIVSSNLANAMTEGYARRELVLSARDIGGIGAGVRVNGIVRHSNPIIIAERRIADAELGHRSTLSSGLSRLEGLFGSADSGTTLADQLNKLEQAFLAATADPSSDINLRDIANQLSRTTDRFNSLADGIQGLRQDADQSIDDQVTRLNTGLSRLDKLNDDISRNLQAGHDPSGLVDQRQVVIDEISEIVPVKLLRRPSGRVALMTAGGEMLVDHRPAEIGFSPAGTIVTEMTRASGGLSGLTINGAPLQGAGPVGRLGGGSLEAAFQLRDEVLPSASENLDKLAADLVTRFSDSATDPSITPGSDGLIAVAPPGFDPMNTAGLATRLSLNPAADPLAGGAVTALRDGLYAPLGNPGDASLLSAWADKLDARVSLATGEPARSLSAHAAYISSAIGAHRVSEEQDTAFAQARVASLTSDELSEAVDSDQEMQRLLMIEKAYAANAKVISTVDGMIRSLLEI